MRLCGVWIAVLCAECNRFSKIQSAWILGVCVREALSGARWCSWWLGRLWCGWIRPGAGRVAGRWCGGEMDDVVLVVGSGAVLPPLLLRGSVAACRTWPDAVYEFQRWVFHCPELPARGCAAAGHRTTEYTT